jgi:hypothetical protein
VLEAVGSVVKNKLGWVGWSLLVWLSRYLDAGERFILFFVIVGYVICELFGEVD